MDPLRRVLSPPHLEYIEGIVTYFVMGYLVLLVWQPSLFLKLHIFTQGILAVAVSLSYYLVVKKVYSAILNKEEIEIHYLTWFNNVFFVVLLTLFVFISMLTQKSFSELQKGFIILGLLIISPVFNLASNTISNRMKKKEL
ncbi:MAG: hypothetical protein ABH874_06515 [Methanobacteriota archaeon]